jgi:protein-L-isoaspartate(D-aspartate) O-methyltransferase
VDSSALERHQMVLEQIRRRGLHDPQLLDAFEKVPRHLFVPEAARFAAYDDSPLPIGWGQTISQPYIVALMTSVLRLCGTDRVLEVGTGSGYQAAVLACLVREVYTVELIPQLAAQAETLLRGLECLNVHVHCGDGSLGWPEAAPYDCIVVTAASPGVPPPLLEQLADGGRLVIPVEHSYDYQLLKLLTRKGEELHENVISSVCFVPLRGTYGRKPQSRA